MLVSLLVALGVGVATDFVVTKTVKVNWLGTVLGMAAFAVVAAVLLGLG